MPDLTLKFDPEMTAGEASRLLLAFPPHDERAAESIEGRRGITSGEAEASFRRRSRECADAWSRETGD